MAFAKDDAEAEIDGGDRRMIFGRLLSQLESPEFQKLRPMQRSILDQYASLLNSNGSVKQADVAIEMPAGTGKTLVALLIAEYHRRLKRQIAILTGTKQLARQVEQDAAYLGIETVVFEGPGARWSHRELGKYQRAETTGIMNYWAYFNINPRPTPAEILILDDAHLAENAIPGIFSARVKKSESSELYNNVLQAINSLRPGRYTEITEILADRPVESPFLLPFSDWHELSDRIVQLLDEAAQTGDEQVQYVWPKIRRHKDALAVFVTPYELQFRPVLYPTKTLRHFSEPIQRVYLSATLGDAEDLQRRIGCDPVHLLKPSNPQPGERGRRMIVLFPSHEEGSDQTEDTQAGLHTLWPVARKRLWLCSSWQEVERWKNSVPPLKNGSRTHIRELVGHDETPLDEFRQASLGHLFTAARYDGIDFPGDQCRLAIIPSPPITSDPQEEFFSAFLQDAAFLKSRFSQRIAQSLGRCNRGVADFAVYVFLDPRFERRFGGNDPDYLTFLPPDIRAEMEAALENCEDGFEACCAAASNFLSGEFEHWDSQVKRLRRMAKARPGVSSSPLPASPEVRGWGALWKGDPSKAAHHFKKCEEKYIQAHVSGPLAFARYSGAWARYLCYIRQNDPVALQDTIELLENAASCGPSYWFTTVLRAAANDLRSSLKRDAITTRAPSDYREAVVEEWEKILFERGLKESSMAKWLSRICENLESSSHDQVAEGLGSLGQLVGFKAFRPEGQGMPDVIWRFSRDQKHVFTWEVKAELKTDRKVSIGDVNQAHGQGRWADNDYSKDGYVCLPVILSAASDLEEGVRNRLGNVRCISQSTLCRLAQTVLKVFEQFRSGWAANNSEKRFEARQRVYRKIPNGDWLFKAHQSSRPGFIPESILLSNWPN